MFFSPFVVLLACSGAIKSAADIEGIWVAEDGTEIRGLVVEPFDSSVLPDHTYSLFLYDAGQFPFEVQRGRISIVEEALVYDVDFDINPSNIGTQFASTIERVNRNELLIQGRSYEKRDALPGDVVLPSGPLPELGGLIWGAGISTGFPNGVRSGVSNRVSTFTEAAGEVSRVRVFGANGEPAFDVPTDVVLHYPVGVDVLLSAPRDGSGPLIQRVRDGGSNVWTVPGEGRIPLYLEVLNGEALVLSHGAGDQTYSHTITRVDVESGAVLDTLWVGQGST